MSDLVCTVPKQRWLDWLMEGDAAGELATGEEWGFWLGGSQPMIEPGERLYVVAWGLVRGYAPVNRVTRTELGWGICRRGGGVACTPCDAMTQPLRIPGFRGWVRRFWAREVERPFPDWMTAGVDMAKFTRDQRERFGRWLTERRAV